AARYAEMNGCAYRAGFDPARCRLTVNRWIVSALAAAARQTEEAIEAFRFNDAANALYQFAWGSFCDWYIEFTKPILLGEDEAAGAKLTLLIKDAAPATLTRLAAHRELVLRLARLERAEPLAGEPPKGAIQVVLDEATLLLPLGGIMDLAHERARLAKEIAR